MDINTISDRVRAIAAQGSLAAAYKLGVYLQNILDDDARETETPRKVRLEQISNASEVPFGRLTTALRVARGMAMLPGVSVKDLHYVCAGHFRILPLKEGPEVLREWLVRIDQEKLSVPQLQHLRRSLPTSKGGLRKKRTMPNAVKATKKVHKLLSDKTVWDDLSSMTAAERKKMQKLLPELESLLQDLIVRVYS